MHYEVAPGMGLGEIARDLEHRGVIERWFYLAGLGYMHDKTDKLKAGEYEFTAPVTPMQLIDKMVAGDVVGYSLTVVEGQTFRQMMNTIHNHEALTHTLVGLSDEEIMAQLGWPGEHPEGRFYPDTYHFPRGMTDVKFLQRAYHTLSERLETEWQNRSPNIPLETPYEALVLASIVEKESALSSERKEIAGVFTRRLQKGMLLQTDPTVIYGMGASFDGDIRRTDLRADTPYNTYVHPGLPPTPIALPSGEAIHAVLHPEQGDSLFFVSRGDGSHVFSATYEQHKEAVREYQLR